MVWRKFRVIVLMFSCCGLHAEPIQYSEAIVIGGIKQWITVSGDDASRPVLLFLHGGPGNSVISFADKFTDILKRHFVVVQWDQRESGKTAKMNSSDQKLTVGLMVSDAIDVVNYLRRRFAKETIYIVGHSWGGFLALNVASSHPELLTACIAIAPMVNQWESERQTLDWLMNKARETNNTEAIGELSRVHIPFGTPDELYYHRRWLLLSDKKNPFSKNYVRNWGKKWFDMYKEACSINLFEKAPEIRCPVYFLVGSNDRQASSTITEAYYHALKTEKKDLFWFTKSGHSLNLTEPKKMQDIILSLRSVQDKEDGK